ncbi:MAG: Dyp-type peroxidase [Polyangiales bacterium]
MTLFDIFSNESQTTVGIDPKTPAVRALLESIQGNILAAHGRNHAEHVFVTFSCDAKAARAWLGTVAADVKSAADQFNDSETRRAQAEKGTEFDGGLFKNVFLSADGYVALGLAVDRFESSFRGGMKSRGNFLLRLAKEIVDLGNKDPAPATWQTEFQKSVHVMVMLADDDAARLESARDALIASLAGVGSAFVERGDRITTTSTEQNKKGKDLEHFGYRDGISQPLFFAHEINEKRSPNFDPSAPIGLVLARDPYGFGDQAFGSYLVFRKLAQDVPGFEKAVGALASKVNQGDAELTGAQIVGRFKDGTPVTRSSTPQGPNADVNDFNYDGDKGQRCPVHAHIRKSNPRGTTPLTSETSERSRRIVRRAIPYGPRGGTDVGLLFMCFQHDIGHQFEFIQRIWVDDALFPRVVPPTGDDPLIGQDNTHAAQRWPVNYGSLNPSVEFDFRSFVTLRGGEYFFAPSMSFFDSLNA